MNAKTLRFIFPENAGIRNEPLPACPKCNGEGYFKNLIGNLRPCFCVCLVESDEVRRIAVESMQKTISALRSNPEPAIKAATNFVQALYDLTRKNR